ncbi:putative host dGTPase inhibitor [Erwinia phage pEp_SNUABM_11]|nr:putative host dGTPase inhibitor [Erwinia phage pEp_SNUABM_11]
MIYSGNLNDFRRAHDRIRSLGFSLENETWKSMRTRTHATRYIIRLSTNEHIVSPTFDHYDEDVQCNNITAWLNKQADALESWK